LSIVGDSRYCTNRYTGISIQRGEGILNVSVRADTLDVQNIRGRWRGIWDSVGVGIVVVNGRGSHGLVSVSNQNRDVDVIDDIHRNRHGNRSGDWDINRNLNSVRNHLRDSNRDGNGNLHLNGTLNLLSNHDVVGPWNMNRNGARNADLRVHRHWVRNTHSLHLLDGNDHRSVCSNCVRRVHVVLSCLDNGNWYRNLDLLHHIAHRCVRLRNSNLLRHSLWLVDGDLHLVRNNLSDRNNHLNGTGYLDLINNSDCLRDIDGLGLCDFDGIRNIHRNLHSHGNCNGLSNWNLLRLLSPWQCP